MKYLFLIIFFLNNAWAFVDPKIGGTIILQKDLIIKDSEKGNLIVEIYGHADNKLIAKESILYPKFPQAFVVTPKHLVNPQFELKDEVDIKVEYSVQLNGQSKILKNIVSKNQKIKIGNKNVIVELIP